MWVAVETQQKLNAGVREEVVAAEGRRGVATATAALVRVCLPPPPPPELLYPPPPLQQAGLNSVKQILDRLERDYVAMAMALDSTRHEMPVVGIAPIHEGQSGRKVVASFPVSHEHMLCTDCGA